MYKSYRRFRQCQATIYYIDAPQGDFVLFYSYLCPKIVRMPNGDLMQFSFEGSRKAGEITSSRTTTKQCNQRLKNEMGYKLDYHALPKIKLKDFEEKYFDTRQDFYY